MLHVAGGHRKGKYIPLRALTSRMGASQLLALQPGLIRDTVGAMASDPICPAAAGLLEAVLGSLRHECLARSGATSLTVTMFIWLRQHRCMPPVTRNASLIQGDMWTPVQP